MARQPDDDLQLLIARLRARGGKVSTNVVAGHNVTAPDGTERRFAQTRWTWPGDTCANRPALITHLHYLLGDPK